MFALCIPDLRMSALLLHLRPIYGLQVLDLFALFHDNAGMFALCTPDLCMSALLLHLRSMFGLQI